MAKAWAPVAGYVGEYSVSTDGDLYSDLSGRLLVRSISRYGYVRYRLRGNATQAHRLVLETFCGPCPDGYATRHLDGNRTNNSLGNLAWGTYSENNYDIVLHGNHNEARKTHCPQGHEYNDENTYLYRLKSGSMNRQCRPCNSKRSLERYRSGKGRTPAKTSKSTK